MSQNKPGAAGVQSIRAVFEAQSQQSPKSSQQQKPVNKLPSKVGSQVGKVLEKPAKKKKPSTPEVKSKLKNGAGSRPTRSSSTSDTKAGPNTAAIALAGVLKSSPSPIATHKSSGDVSQRNRRSMSSSTSPPPSPRSGRFSSSFSSTSPPPELRVESPTGEVEVVSPAVSDLAPPLNRGIKARSTGNIAALFNTSDSASAGQLPAGKPPLKPKPPVGPKPAIAPKPHLSSGSAGNSRPISVYPRAKPLSNTPPARCKSHHFSSTPLSAGNQEPLGPMPVDKSRSQTSPPPVPIDAVRKSCSPPPTDKGRSKSLSTSPPPVSTHTPSPSPSITSDHESPRSLLVNGSSAPPSPQTMGQTTPAGKVGGCMRNADSGYQEDLVDDQESPTLPPPKKDEVVWDEAKREKARDKRHHIAMELLATEKSYVDRLRVVAEKFRSLVKELNAKCSKPLVSDHQMHLIFLNIGEIFVLNRQLLEDLQNRMDDWDKCEQIGDVISTIAPFLKLYATYTSGFEEAMKLLTHLMSKEKKLDIAVKDFEKQQGSGLGITHYMLEPVQRIPRYRLLLADYLKNLPPDSEERPSAEKALKIISEAADRTNNRIKELENCNEILSIQQSLSEYQDTLLQPGRSFVMKGQLQKLSRKTATPRMFFLFSDVLLHTEPTGPTSFRFKNLLPLISMKVEIPKVSLTPNTFEVMCTTRSLIMGASSEEERTQWVNSLHKAINDERSKRMSLKRGPSLISGYDEEEEGFGSHAPIMVLDQNVSMCQLCSKMFTLTFRRHHCRACGKVVCGDCSRFKVYLPYMHKKDRVCQDCHKEWRQCSLDENDAPPPSPHSPAPDRRLDGPAVLMIDEKEREKDTVMEAYVMVLEGKKWTRYWYILMKDLALYKFRAHEDIKAIQTIPLPGYKIETDKLSCTISLIHPSSKKKKYNVTFKSDSVDEYEAWIDTLDKATRLVIPEPVKRDGPHLLSPMPVTNDRLRSKSLCLLDEEDEQVEEKSKEFENSI